MSGIVHAAQTCSSTNPETGMIVRLVEGQAWDANDPFVRARPQLFIFSDPPTKSTVEKATSVPGEKRDTRRASK